MERTFIPELPVGYFQIPDLTTSVSLETAWTTWSALAPTTNPSIAQHQYVVLFDAEGGNIRWRNDNTAPTSALGGRLIQDTQMVYTANGLSTLKFIEETVGAKLNVSIFRTKI